MARNIAYHNSPPSDEPIPENAPSSFVKAELGRRLSHHMERKGWNQSQLARQAALHIPGGKFGRDSLSGYVRGRHFPGPIHLKALCKALNVKPEDLVPPRAVPSVDDAAPPLDMRDLGDGTVFVRINKRLPWAKALKILNIAQGEE